MPTIPDSDIYPSTTYIDNLLFPQYLKTNDATSIEVQAHEDWLLSAYIKKLNEEIIDEIKEFREYKEVIKSLFFNVRTHGWAVIQPYNDGEYRVFSSTDFVDWIKEQDNNSNKMNKVGLKVKWKDDIGNTWEDSLYFDDRENENKEIIGKCYLFIWEKGNGRELPSSPSLSKFAIADLSVPVLSLSIQTRQILNTLVYTSTNPYFYHLIYGDTISPTQRKNLITQMSYVSYNKAIGAKKSILDSIVAIENQAVDKTISALNEVIGLFAGETRLPVSFYLGEKQIGSGLNSGGAENVDEIKVGKKKDYILMHFIEGLNEFFGEELGIQLPDLYNYYHNLAEKKKQEAINQFNKNQNGMNQNEEGTQGTDQDKKVVGRSDN